MFGKFLPYSADFFKFFEMHIEVCLQGAEVLKKMIDNPNNPAESAATLALLESEGDEIARLCIEDLHKTFITPFERNDIYQLITSLDDIIDFIEDVATCIVIYKPQTRKNLQIQNILVDVIQELKKIIFGMRKPETLESVKPLLINIHKLENKGDYLTEQSIGLLFEEEKNPIELIKWKDIYEKLEEAVDSCQRVGHIIEGLIMESS